MTMRLSTFLKLTKSNNYQSGDNLTIILPQTGRKSAVTDSRWTAGYRSHPVPGLYLMQKSRKMTHIAHSIH